MTWRFLEHVPESWYRRGFFDYPTIPAFNRWVNEATGEIAELPVGKHPSNKEAGWQCDTCRCGATPCNDPAMCRGPSAPEAGCQHYNIGPNGCPDCTFRTEAGVKPDV